MKEIRIPFNIKVYNKSAFRVETRGNADNPPKKVRILCTDLKYDDGPSVVAAVEISEGKEIVERYFSNGYYFRDRTNYWDLVLIKPKFEDGDIIKSNRFKESVVIYRGTNYMGEILSDTFYDFNDGTINILSKNCGGFGETKDYYLATEDEKKIFFDALAKNGKRWNDEKKCIEPIKKKYNFKQDDLCLFRDTDYELWKMSLFVKQDTDGVFRMYNEGCHKQCIPFNDETKHLLNKSENAPEKYQTW